MFVYVCVSVFVASFDAFFLCYRETTTISLSLLPLSIICLTHRDRLRLMMRAHGFQLHPGEFGEPPGGGTKVAQPR